MKVEEIDFILKLPKVIEEKLPMLELNTAFLCHSLLFKKEIGGIMVICNDELLKKFGLSSEMEKYSPEFKVRMFNFRELLYIFESELVFANKSVLRIHISPKENAFRNLMTACIKQELISVHFYNKDSGNTLSIHLSLEDETEWFERNLEVSKSIRMDSFVGFKNLSTQLIKEEERKDIIYFVHDKKVKSLSV
jgi:hypothetical protein